MGHNRARATAARLPSPATAASFIETSGGPVAAMQAAIADRLSAANALPMPEPMAAEAAMAAASRWFGYALLATAYAVLLVWLPA